jgi:hypothetical protein
MAVHTDFWIVVGTASPVILLAAAVTSGDVILTKVPITNRREEKQSEDVPYWIYLLSVSGWLVQAVIFIVALQSLADGSDVFPPRVMVIGESIGVLVLGLLSNSVAKVRRDSRSTAHQLSVRDGTTGQQQQDAD